TAAVASSPKLLDRVRWHLRVKHYSIRTEQAYADWIRRYILFHRKRHPNEMGEKEIAEFLTHLAVEKSVAASTQNQAFSALLFLYQQVLERKLDIIVRDAKGLRDRITILPERLRHSLQVHLDRVQEIHQHDLRKRGGRVYLPFALEHKYRNANRSWSWQYAFPAAKVSTDPRSGE